MPTRNRRAFVSQSIWYFLRQDYPNKELVVLDDGEDGVADLIPADERIRYVRVDRHVLGAKRNLGCELSRGELIAHWDDDDWMAPHRLSTQVNELLSSKSDLCGLRQLLHYSLDDGAAWSYNNDSSERPWLAGGTLLYRRTAWARARFPEINVGEDTQFVWQHSAESIRVVADPSLYVALIHKGNTSAKRLSDPHWERRPFDEVSQLLALDRDFYVNLRNGNGVRKVADHPPRVSTITVGAPFMVYDGYGSMAELVVLGMERAGARVNVVPFEMDANGLSEEFREVVRRSHPDNSAPTLYFCWPRPDLERFRHSSEPFIYTMWESSRLPADWPKRLNHMRAVLVPTRFCAKVCRDSGVHVPVEVVPLGVDPNIYHYKERPSRQELTTLIVGTVVGRKHVTEAIAAWKLAFATVTEARLIIKSRFSYGNYGADDPRINFIDSNEPTRGIAHWYEQADILVAVGSEGFGLPLVEGMATGLPVIALNSEGQSDVCEDAGPDCLLPVAPERWEKCNDAPFGPCGVRGVPGIKAIADRLCWIASNREQAREMGRRASEWVIEQRNIWKTGPAVLNVVERHLRAARSLKRPYTFVVPTWQTPCGVAEYTRHICEGMAGVTVTSRAPAIPCSRVLHIQHEPSLFDDAALTAMVQKARAQRVPVVITEHSVLRSLPAWEREADALVTLSQSGKQMLRERWPEKRIEYIPCGCPTWFPSRKKRRGRVIGAFGFLETHKGFWKLLEVLRALPDTELFLVSHAKNAGNEAQWTRAALGLRVNRRDGFLPVTEVARLLAAEADILVYWYDEIEHVSASSAVRVGLATGVPVLTSPTRWFEDLRGATFQPHDLIEGVQRLLEDTELRQELNSAARDYCHENSWPHIAQRHLELWQSLEATH